MSWNHLPAELRNSILSHIAEEYSLSGRGSNLSDATSYATVSREWQGFFEGITFQNISLIIHDATDLDDFARFTSGSNVYRRCYIRNISVIIVLPPYDCEDCCGPESAEETERNNNVFTQSMQALLGILSTWTPNPHQHGLTLELNIKSSSDTDHHFYVTQITDEFRVKHWNWSHEDKLFAEIRYPDHCNDEEVWCDSVSTQLRSEGCRALERYLGSLLEFTDLRLPRVEVVTSFMQRHQFKRQLSPCALGRLMQESLVRLSSLRLERWCRPRVKAERMYIRHFKEHFLPCLPESLEVFQYYAERPMSVNLSAKGRVKPLSLVELLSIEGHRFKQISVVEPYDSTVCLQTMKSITDASLTKPLVTAGWHMLEKVCFESKVVGGCIQRKNRRMDRIDELLKLSASMAQMMPNLRSWEIYGLGIPSLIGGCHFHYSVQLSSSSASISWKGWWINGLDNTGEDFSFSPNVKSAWDEVAILHTGNGVTCLVDENQLADDDIDHPRMETMVFELDPIHPFTRHLDQWGYEALATASHDE
ncbi:hypothetical protein FPSE_10848 [Fusarium pseudograminearum CS3096]|uniref:DUF6546 domain-containing protein n=1 Tax=Fusarium pseudograminearum (strain CS3096) TaxID=1028729 RepID=K3VXI8_FUSPC|nr:hypothetical protein FPSE_10848 [Fusarium pseudograminearum CS3096]EKJ68975.1 hypothetical protein FPSE_10848 [Fusarium pseudograminearum CS3096]KAF0639189.1 hypothetical protein FPSE5266_10848 [Fusarium pseudograminearum]